MIYTIITLLSLLVITLSWIVANLLKKLERYEDVIAMNTDNYIQILNDMKEIDSTGAFESDDEVGSTFQDLKNLISNNQKILNGNDNG
jgi:hypothetical protein